MKSKVYTRCSFIMVALLAASVNLFSQITGPTPVCEGTTGVTYTAPADWGAYNWSVSGGITFSAGATPDIIIIDWTVRGTYTLSVNDGTNPDVTLDVTVDPTATITGPLDATGMPATLKNGSNPGQVYTTEPGMGPYAWTVPPEGTIVAGDGTTNSITVDWAGIKSQQSLSVVLTNPNVCSDANLTLIVNYFPYAGPINAASIPKFVDPLPHFAAGLRVNAKNGGNLIIRTVPVQQIALPVGTTLGNGKIIGTDPGAGIGNYVAYQISRDGGKSYGPAMWPAQTIEAKQGNQLTISYENSLPMTMTYDHFSILADQTLMMNGYTLTGPALTEPYLGQIPMVVHLHGGEIPSDSDGGPNSWFMPDGTTTGPGFKHGASRLVTYPNQQEAGTLWYHPHDDGLTRINVYTGLAGYYFLRGDDEEKAQLPGWSGDDMVVEATPPGKTATFNGPNAYLPEIELGIQDRMFDVNGALYWPVAPPNPELHPFWTPEFIGDIFVVNGKTWPYLSVAPRKYRFRILDGCNARWLNMWLVDSTATGLSTPGPAINVVGIEGGLLSSPVALDPALNEALNIGPGQRADVVIDFSAFAGRTLVLKQNASAPFPFGDPVVPGLTDVIMQFVVNGSMVSPGTPTALGSGKDNSQLPVDLRTATPMVQLTDFAGNIDPAITPAVKRQIILNEVMSFGGPAAVMVNNTYFDAALAVAGDPNAAGGPTEFPLEGTTEIIEIANVSADAHPMHIHLMQWQLVSRTPIDDVRYLQAYANAWKTNHPDVLPFPAGAMDYPGGAGTPFGYGIKGVEDVKNEDGAVGGNPAFSPFVDPTKEEPAKPEEMGWKDNVTVLPGYVSKFVMRVAPTDRPVNAAPADLMFPFDPSLGPGYVWHCHIIDHEDMSMMRPLEILPSPLRLTYPQITTQPVPRTACAGDALTYSVTVTDATPPNTVNYQWQVSIDGGKIWTDLTNTAPYSTVTTSSLAITPVSLAMTGYKYRCVLTNATPGAVTISSPAPLTVNACSISGTLKYNNLTKDPLANFTVSANGGTAVTDAAGAFVINNVTSGSYPINITTPMLPGGVNSTDAGTVKAWELLPSTIPNVKYMAGDVDNNTLINATDATGIQNNFVDAAAAFARGPWVFWDAIGQGVSIPNPPQFMSDVNGESVTGFDILGMCTGDFNSSFSPVTPGVSTVLLTSTGLALKVPVATPFDLPINSVSAIPQLGAVSLILNVPSNLVQVNSVKVGGIPAVFKHAGNVLKIAWYSPTAVPITAGGSLVVINMTPLTGFTTTQTLRVTLAASNLNELADGLFVPIANPALTVDNVQVTAKASNTTLITLSMVPNPATKGQDVTINYILPLPGVFSIEIYDTKGLLMKSLANNKPSGDILNSSIAANLGTLLKGNYYLRLTLIPTDGSIPQTTAIKIMIK